MSCKEVNVSLGSTFLKRNLITLGHCTKKIKELLESLANTYTELNYNLNQHICLIKKTIPVFLQQSLVNLKKIQHDYHHLIGLFCQWSWILGQRVKKGCHKIGALSSFNVRVKKTWTNCSSDALLRFVLTQTLCTFDSLMVSLN